MSHSELLVALVDKVATVPTARKRNIDTSAPMELGLAAEDDVESLREEGDQRIVDLAMQAVHFGPAKGKYSFCKESQL